MTSSSASGSTWRVLYGSGVLIAGRRRAGRGGCSRPQVLERAREGLVGIRAEAPEQVAHDVARGGRDGQGQDRPEQPGQGAADDDREDDRGRMELDRVALDLGHEQVVLELLDEGVQDEGGDDRLEAGGGGQEDRGHGRDDRADDGHELEDAGRDRQQDGDSDRRSGRW